MTPEQEQALLDLLAYFSGGVRHSDDGLVPYVMTQGRFGVQTEYWSKQPVGQGAGLSVGVSDRFGIYSEIDTAICPDFPSVAISGRSDAPNALQPNIAVEAIAANSPLGNAELSIQGQGIAVQPGEVVLVGVIGQPNTFKQVYP